MKKNYWLNDLPGRIAKVVQAVIVAGLSCILFGFSGFRAGGTAEVLLADNGQAIHSIVVEIGRASCRERV